MVYSGKVIDGAVVHDGGVTLPEGANVRVEVQPDETTSLPKRQSLAAWAKSNAEHWGDQICSAEPESFAGRGD